MSDADDLLKLKKLLDEGAITADEYELEKAWILGTTPQLVPREAKILAAKQEPAVSDAENKEQEQAIINSTLRSMEIMAGGSGPIAGVTGDTAPAAADTDAAAPAGAAAEDTVITVDQVMKNAAAGSMLSDKTDEEKRAEDAAAAGFTRKEEVSPDGQKASGQASDQPQIPPADNDRSVTGAAGDILMKMKEEKKPEDKKEGESHIGEFTAKIVALIFSLPVLNPIGLILVLIKKPFSRIVNILLTIWNIFWTIFLIAALSIMLYSAYVAGQVSSLGAGSAETAAVSASVAAGTGTTDAASAAYNSFLDDLNSAMKESYGDNYTVTDNGKILTVSLWQDGVAKEAALAIEGEDGAQESWDSLNGVMQALSVTLFEQANEENPERHVQLNVLNDENTDKLLLTYVDGSCVYDAVKAAKENAAAQETAAAEGTAAEETTKAGESAATELTADDSAAVGKTSAEEASAEKTTEEEAAAEKTTAGDAADADSEDAGSADTKSGKGSSGK